MLAPGPGTEPDGLVFGDELLPEVGVLVAVAPTPGPGADPDVFVPGVGVLV